MATLLVSSWQLKSAQPLALAAQSRGWKALSFDDAKSRKPRAPLAVYSGTDLSAQICQDYHLKLVEPSWDLLARLPQSLRLRSIEMSTAGTLSLARPMFIKPADPSRRVFDAGIYGSLRDIRLHEPLQDDFPLLVAEQVEFAAEYRVFLLGSEIVASSPYMMDGRPIWRPYGSGGEKDVLHSGVEAFVRRVTVACAEFLPSVCVMDVGLIDGRGWAVVEFNPVWCAGLLGADPARVLDLLKVATEKLSAKEPNIDRFCFTLRFVI